MARSGKRVVDDTTTRSASCRGSSNRRWLDLYFTRRRGLSPNGFIITFVTALLVRGSAAYSDTLSENAWMVLAQNAVNATAFCLPRVYAVGALMETCFVGVCTDLDVLRQHSWLYAISKDWSYKNLYALGPGAATYTMDASMYSFRLANVTTAGMCVYFVNARQVAVNHTNNELICRHKSEASFAYGHMKLPTGWFLLCGRTAFTYVPANSSGGPCAIGRVAPLLFPHPEESAKGRYRYRRGSIPLDSTCKAEVTLFSEQEAAALTFTLIGLPGMVAHNYHAIVHLACVVAKALNLTSTALALLTQELGEVRRGVLQNRMAIDYLLLRYGHSCMDFAGMCCFNITDVEPAVNEDVKHLQRLADGIRQQQEDSWLWSWLSSLRGWTAHIVQGVILGIICLFSLACLYVCCLCSRRCCGMTHALVRPSWSLESLEKARGGL
ncbi:uncharacterized protein LOC120384988 [Mauremys reevesii]|uniref:uncharacterized protein LOC120384988 n=1 Tax=Mauremys reevesii TaxID=260615 RepID=UPI00193F799D|nr:uncharacterized protein LOC120384988 [Mauremys reevesii]